MRSASTVVSARTTATKRECDVEKAAKVFVAGHNGLVGSALVRKLKKDGYQNLLLLKRSRLDLTRQEDVERFFHENRPDYVLLAAAKVGGILANHTRPAEFIYENLIMESNIIHASWQSGVKRLLFLGSSCIYPKECPQPMKEEYLLTGALEPTNEPYAVAKIAGIKLCQSYNRQYGTRFFSVMPTNLYGPNDNFDLESSHVLPALIRKFHEAKIRKTADGGREAVEIWGTGDPRREFLHVDDLAEACIFLINLDNDTLDSFAAGTGVPLVNIGWGKDITIRDLAELIRNIVGFKGELCFDTGKPDGTPRKLLDVSRLAELGWHATIPLEEGIRKTYRWCLENRIFEGQ